MRSIIEYALPSLRRTSHCVQDASYPAETLVVLVHGWNGHLTKTWGRLLEFVRVDPDFDGCDVLFLGYPSSPTGADALAEWIAKQLCSVWPEAAHRPGDSFQGEYTSLVLVGHSLGAVALRAALLKLGEDDIVQKCVLELLAPPLRGAHLAAVAKELGREGSLKQKFFGLFLSSKNPVWADLETGSEFLENLRDETEIQGAARANLFGRIRLGLLDKIVVTQPDLKSYIYSGDLLAVQNEFGHSSICKVGHSDHGGLVLDWIKMAVIDAQARIAT